jgi:pentatricopeptide repeat protein
MEQRAKLTNNNALQPNIVTVNSVINAWAKNKELNAAERAEEILNWTEDLYGTGNKNIKPDTIAYSTVINAYAGVGNAVEAEKVLRRLLERYETTKDPDLRPTVISYNTTIDAWAKSDDRVDSFKRALALLNEMKELEQMGATRLSPNSGTYSSIFRSLAMAKDSKLDRIRIIQAILKEMESRSVVPDEHCLSHAMMACSRQEGSEKQRQNSLELAKRIFRDLYVRFDPPQAGSHANYILACANGNDWRLLEQTYRNCCFKGLGQDKQVIRAVKRTAPHLLSSY